MKRTMKYVAFDVHQTTTVASVRDDSGRVLARSVLETSTRLIVHNRRDQRALARKPELSMISLMWTWPRSSVHW